MESTPPTSESPKPLTATDSAADIAAAIGERAAVAPTPLPPDTHPGGGYMPPPPTPPSKKGGRRPLWMSEPRENFEWDADGKVMRHANGLPVRRRGAPSAGAAGHPQESTVGGIGEGAADTTTNATTGAATPPRGEAVGKVLIDGVRMVAGSVDEKAKPTKAEQEVIDDYGPRAFGGAAVPTWLALATVLCVWGGRVLIQSRKSKKEDESDAPTRDRADHERKIGVGEAAEPGRGTIAYF